MTKTIDLLHGKIMRSLCILAVPIVMTYFIQMAYNFIDMIWIGRLGSGAVAGVGVAGMFTWFSNGLVMMAKMGGQVKIGHCLGAGDDDDARRYLGAALKLGIVFALFFGIGINILAHSLIGFFHLSSPAVIHDAVLYLRITCGLVIFTFMNQIFTSSFNVYGDSRTPFIMNTCGLVSNVIADRAADLRHWPFPGSGRGRCRCCYRFCPDVCLYPVYLCHQETTPPLPWAETDGTKAISILYTDYTHRPSAFSAGYAIFMLFHADCPLCRRLRGRRCSCAESRHSG